MAPAFGLGIRNRILRNGMEGHESREICDAAGQFSESTRSDPYLTCERRLRKWGEDAETFEP